MEDGYQWTRHSAVLLTSTSAASLGSSSKPLPAGGDDPPLIVGVTFASLWV